MRLRDLRGRRRNLSKIELRPESFTNPLELLAVPVKAGSVYEMYLEILGEPTPDAVTFPTFRVYGGVSASDLFDMAPDDPGLLTNGTTEGDPWALSDGRRGLILEDGILRVSAWVKDGTDPEVPALPSNSLIIDKGILIVREM